jgi:hypothetical protein
VDAGSNPAARTNFQGGRTLSRRLRGRPAARPLPSRLRRASKSCQPLPDLVAARSFDPDRTGLTCLA